jgi:hypothetical protein
MKKPEVIMCPAGCGTIRVNRKKKRCSVCGVKLFYHGDFIDVSDIENIKGFIYLGTKWVPISSLIEKL